ncbi:serine/threonine-protein kinase [Corallococcus macrosporus]|uniref:non-specific serine/threonine protein kinase n=1 Tax=Corallococcus macrosporus DSM 14697 TaxID=1189310 RepID=A0A250JSK9_9BACT|nr:serine/threonine-protein kinase [Corallococcus macrosporus]ATB46106.1 protein kinase [Corallococcus macrosporus DSM 14697]
MHSTDDEDRVAYLGGAALEPQPRVTPPPAIVKPPPRAGFPPAPPRAETPPEAALRPVTPPPALSLGETLRPVTPMSPHGTWLQGVPVPAPSSVMRGLVPGQTVAQRYRVERWLGAGGSSTVYEATDLRQDVRVALKVLAVPHADDALVARFRQEVEHARALEHVNILRVFDAGVDGERHFLTVELLDGVDLRQRLLERRATLAEALRWLTHATVALEHAHGRGVLHRDVKPANLFITRTGVLKLMDFGLAKSTHVMGTTAQGAVLGTPEYMAPEQVTGNPAVSPATDLYALGVVAYELFTGQLPFRHPEPVPLMFLHVQERPVPPRTLRPDLPEPFERVVLKLLEKRPEDRYRTATELRSALARLWPRALQGPAPTLAAPAPPRASLRTPDPGGHTG